MNSQNFPAPPDIQSRVINPLVKRHAEDAAFYWMQRNSNAYSPILHFERLKHFDRLLNAHLDGLRVAEDEGWKIALANLQRWRTNGEAFVAYALAFNHDHKRPQQLWDIVSKLPDTTHDGLVSALGWLPDSTVSPWLEAWIQRDDMPLMQALALRTYSIRRSMPSVSPEPLFCSRHTPVRAAAFTLAGRLRMESALPYLPQACKAEDLTESASAIIAMQLLGKGEAVLSDFWQILNRHYEVAEESKGLTRQIARRRTEALARHLGHAVPLDHPGLPQVFAQLPPRLALKVMAHHGDAALIPKIIEAMNDEALSRLAGWAFSMITGIDLDAARLSMQTESAKNDEDEDELTTPLEDPDAGLPIPHKEAIKFWWQAHAADYLGRGKLLLGNAANDKAHCFDTLRSGTQVVRFAAALNLASSGNAMPYIETRAAALLQEQVLNRLLQEVKK